MSACQASGVSCHADTLPQGRKKAPRRYSREKGRWEDAACLSNLWLSLLVSLPVSLRSENNCNLHFKTDYLSCHTMLQHLYTCLGFSPQGWKLHDHRASKQCTKKGYLSPQLLFTWQFESSFTLHFSSSLFTLSDSSCVSHPCPLHLSPSAGYKWSSKRFVAVQQLPAG